MPRTKWLLVVVVAFATLVFRYLHNGTGKGGWPSSEADVRGRRVLITGASSGIGESLAYAYARLGAKILLTARRGHLLKTIADKCRLLGAARVDYVVADMSEPAERQTVINETRKLFDGRLDHLILNHALLLVGTWNGKSEDMADLRTLFEVNFVSYVDLTFGCLDMLRASSARASIGVVSSILGKVSQPYVSMYTASKFALQGFFGSLRQELMTSSADETVSVTLFILGLIDTDMVSTLRDTAVGAYLMEFAGNVNDTADLIIKGVVSRTYEAYYPLSIWCIVQAHKFIPKFMEDMIGKQAHAHVQESSLRCN